ncbi:MAG: hypothetical protein JW795_07845 [Chitinivibrionales bacterium]|nr:hypothetical protein [Chitinivibrionales bacterium]
MTQQKKLPEKEQKKLTLTQTILPMVKKPWFPALAFLAIAILYFLPYLNLHKVIHGGDDNPRDWHSVGNYGYEHRSLFDRWMPHNGGTTAMEQRFGSFINPTYPFHMILPKYKARTLEYLFWMFIAGYCTFLFLRSLGASKKAAFIGGLAYMIAPAFQSYIYGGHFARMSVIAMMPGVMFFTQRLLTGRCLLHAIGLVIVLSLCLYSQHVQLFLFVCMGMAAYYIALILHAYFRKQITLSEGIKRSSLFAAALIVTMLVTSMNSFPTLHDTTKSSKRAGGVDYTYASSFSLHPEEMVNLLQPDFISWNQTYWGQNPLKLNSEYFGICILLCAILLFLLKRPTANHYILLALLVFGVLFSLGAHTPLHKLFYLYFPGIKTLRAPSFMYIWIFLPAVCFAALGLDELLKLKWDSASLSLRRRLIIFACIATGLCGLYMMATGPFIQFWYHTILPLDMQSQQKESLLPTVIKNAQAGAVIIFLIVTSFFVLSYVYTSQRLGKTSFLCLLSMLILIDLVRISRPFLTQAVYPNNFFTRQVMIEQSIANFFKAKDPSIYRVHHLINDSRMSIPGLELTYIFDDFINKRYNELIQTLQQDFYLILQAPTASDVSQRILQLTNILNILNIKYILSLQPLAIPGLSEVISNGGLSVYQNINCFPRYYLADSLVLTDDAEATTFQLLNQSPFNRSTVIVEKNSWADHTLADQSPPLVDASLPDSVEVVSYQPFKGYAKLSVHTHKKCFLVVSENYNSGWHVTIDKKPSDVIPVNFFAKAVIVPKGESTVEFEYYSTSAKLWRKVTLISGILFLLFSITVVIWTWKKKNQNHCSSTPQQQKKA